MRRLQSLLKCIATWLFTVVVYFSCQSNIHASCGDYLDHLAVHSIAGSSLPRPLAPNHEAPLCKSGKCNESPFEPFETTRADDPRIHCNRWIDFVNGDDQRVNGKCRLSNETLPESPCQDVAVPPPRVWLS